MVIPSGALRFVENIKGVNVSPGKLAR